MEDELDLKIHRVLKLHGYISNKMSEDSVIGFISFVYSPITHGDYELYTAIQKLVVYLYKLKVSNTQFSVEKHEIEPEVRQFMIDSLTERILKMLTPYGENYEYLKSWVSKRFEESVFGKWKYDLVYYSVCDDLVESMLEYIENHYKTLIFTIEQLPKLFLQSVFNEAYEYCMPRISLRYQNLAEGTPTTVENNIKIIEKIEDNQSPELKDSDMKSAVVPSIRIKCGGRVIEDDKGSCLILPSKPNTVEKKFYDLCKEVLELKPLNSSDLIKPSDAIVRLDDFMQYYSPRPYHDILEWFDILRAILKIRKRSPEYKIVDYFHMVMEDKDNERIQEIPLFLKVQYLYSVLEYEIIASKPKSIVRTSALIYDLLIVLNQIKRPGDYNTFNNKDKYDRVKRYLEIDKSTGMYKMMI